MKNFLLVVLSLTFQNLFSQDVPNENKIIYLLSPFRSGSTALMRSFTQNQNFTVFNEPAGVPFCYAKHIDQELGNTFYAKVKNEILLSHKVHHVFVKDISITALKWIMHQTQFLQMPEVKFILLVRNPYDTLLSLYKKEKPKQFCGDFIDSYSALIELNKQFIEKNLHAQKRYALIISEQLFSNPEAALKKIYNRFGLSFNPHILTWDSKDRSFDPQEWHNAKDEDQFHFWHQEALSSTCFKPLAQSRLDFTDFREEDRPFMKELYEKALPYYKALICYHHFLEKE